MNTIIDVDNVTVRFNLEKEKTDTIKEYVLKLLQHKLKFNEFLALRNVTFRIEKGESVALIGVNGSGKSTLLKVMAGVMTPYEGCARINGTIAPLIELGAGFDMEMTARENIFLNGALMGHSRREMEQHFDGIIDFSELHEFVDVPIKNYSSGMVARLAFAVATCIRADILVVDEILAVGDYNFQQKCHARMTEMISAGTTLLFVSHDIDKVRQLCRRAIWLDHGRVLMDGPSDEVCDAYMERLNQSSRG